MVACSSWVVYAIQITILSLVVADPYDTPFSDQPEEYSDRFGVLKLPKIDYKHLPHECNAPLPDACLAEDVGNYSKAFSVYESRLEMCGWKGFIRQRMTGEGKVAPVYLMTSPCGTQFTGKFGHKEHSVNHIIRNCDFLRRLLPRVSDDHCRGCFPKYFHFSNYTGVCYAELVHAMPMPAFLQHVNRTNPEALMATVRLALHQGLDALRILQSEGMRHQDLTFRNVMVRVKPRNDPSPFRVVIYDFGVSYMKGLTQDIKARGGMGNHGYSDAHAWACAFYDLFYAPGMHHLDGCRFSPRDLSAFHPQSLVLFLSEIMRTLRRNYDEVDYSSLQERLRLVTQF
jgi:hypothetical protein